MKEIKQNRRGEKREKGERRRMKEVKQDRRGEKRKEERGGE